MTLRANSRTASAVARVSARRLALTSQAARVTFSTRKSVSLTVFCAALVGPPHVPTPKTPARANPRCNFMTFSLKEVNSASMGCTNLPGRSVNRSRLDLAIVRPGTHGAVLEVLATSKQHLCQEEEMA